MEINELSWSVWTMFGAQWRIAPMGGLYGWDGYSDALLLLTQGHRLTGVQLIAEMERLRVYEAAQLEIEQARREWDEKHPKKPQQQHLDKDEVEGDLEGFNEEDE